MDLSGMEISHNKQYWQSLHDLTGLANLLHSIRCPTQIWQVTRHQYGISVLVSQTTFREEPVVTSRNIGCFLKRDKVRIQTVQTSRFRRDSPDFAWKSRIPTNMRSGWEKSRFWHLLWFFQMNSYDIYTRTHTYLKLMRRKLLKPHKKLK